MYLPLAIERVIKVTHVFEGHADCFLASSLRKLFKAKKQLNPLAFALDPDHTMYQIGEYLRVR